MLGSISRYSESCSSNSNTEEIAMLLPETYYTLDQIKYMVLTWKL